MLKCLKPLPASMYDEHREQADFNRCLAGEPLSIPYHRCTGSMRDDGAGCQCHRAFVGLASGAPCSLARVELATEEELAASLGIARPDVFDSYLEGSTGVVLFGLWSMSRLLDALEPGTLLRVCRDGNKLHLLDIYGEDEPAEAHEKANAPGE